MRSIVSTPRTNSGSPRIDGTRLTCANVTLALWHGHSLEAYLASYDYLTKADVLNCLSYCAKQQCIAEDVHSYCQQCTLDKRPKDPDLARKYDEFKADDSANEEPEDVWKLALSLLGELEVEIEVSASARKRRLYAVACCRRIWPLLTDQRSRTAVEVAECYADGLATDATLTRAAVAAGLALEAAGIEEDDDWHENPAICAAFAACESVAPDEALKDVIYYECDRRASVAARFLGLNDGFDDFWQDVFGGYFSDAQLDPDWCTTTVVNLAQTIYQERRFELMPILGDALEDAGCRSQVFLSHCRDVQNHVRGCWVVDLLLGKE